MEDPIFKFDGLKRLLRSRGYQIDEAKPYETKTGVDVGLEEFQTGKLSFNADGGIKYIDDDGHEHIGFLYMRSYDLESWGPPRMHTVRCRTLDDFINRGTFAKEYRFAETRRVMVYDRPNDEEREMDNLPHCKNCARMLMQNDFRGVSGSADFENLVERSEKYRKYRENAIQKEVDVDIFGYSKDWKEVSKNYIASKGCTCEKCGVKIEDTFDLQFLRVHHKNGRREDNRTFNLICLCPACYADIDEEHRTVMTTGGNEVLYRDFILRYKNKI